MNKKYIFITSLLSIFIIIWFYFYNNSNTQDDVIKDALIKNINWDSPLQKTVPYVIWNKIELYYILDSAVWNDISINLSLLTEKFDISSIFIWEKELELSDNINFKITKNTPLKITGIAKNNSNYDEKKLRELIKINTSFSKKNENKSINNFWNNTKDTSNESWETKENISVIDGNIWSVKDEIISQNNFDDLKFNETSFNSNINNLLEISWKNIDKIQFLNIWSYSFSPTIKNSKAYFLINENTFNSGNYFVFIQPIEWKIIPLETQINFTFTNSQISIANITPNIVNNTNDSYIVLQWKWFSDIISLQLNNNIILQKTSFNIINDKVLSVKIDKQLDPWKYHFNIMTTDNIINLDNMTFTITQ